MKKKTSGTQMAKMLGISPARGMEAVIKAQLISAVLKAVKEHGFTHQDLAKLSGLSRSKVIGILTGASQKITIARVLRLIGAVGMEAEIKVSKAAKPICQLR